VLDLFNRPTKWVKHDLTETGLELVKFNLGLGIVLPVKMLAYYYRIVTETL
jgi:hypothetical protein